MPNDISQLLGSPNDATTGGAVDTLPLHEDTFGAFSIDEYRPMKVIIIGAGASGIVAAIRQVTMTMIPADVASDTAIGSDSTFPMLS